jgi:hypothetical protein
MFGVTGAVELFTPPAAETLPVQLVSPALLPAEQVAAGLDTAQVMVKLALGVTWLGVRISEMVGPLPPPPEEAPEEAPEDAPDEAPEEEAPDAPDDAPEAPEEAPEAPEEAPEAPEDAPEAPDEAPEAPEEAPEAPEEAPEEAPPPLLPRAPGPLARQPPSARPATSSIAAEPRNTVSSLNVRFMTKIP